jgi:hypothetical protein
MWWPGTELNRRRQPFQLRIEQCQALRQTADRRAVDDRKQRGQLIDRIPCLLLRMVAKMTQVSQPLFMWPSLGKTGVLSFRGTRGKGWQVSTLFNAPVLELVRIISGAVT